MDEIHELTAGYALDALDAAERDAFEAHLAGCERCREELASFWEVTGALAVAAGGPAPPPALRARVLDAVRAAPQTVVPLEPRRRRRSLLVPAVGAAAALAAAVAIGLGLWSVSLAGELADTRSALELQERAAAVLADPAARTVSLATGSGRLVVDAGGRAVLVVDRLGRAPGGKTYQVWVVEGGEPTSAALFPGSGAASVVPLEEPVPAGAVVAVTVERAGGAEAPTSEPVVASERV